LPWAKIRTTAGCEDPAADDAAVLEELEGAAQLRMAEELGRYAGADRGPGWMPEEDSELERISSFAVDPGEPGEGILWEAFRELEQERFRVFVNGCSREWMAGVQEAERVMQEEEDDLTGVQQTGAVQGTGDEEDRETQQQGTGWEEEEDRGTLQERDFREAFGLELSEVREAFGQGMSWGEAQDAVRRRVMLDGGQGSDRMVVVENLATNVTAEMLQAIFKQVGSVLHSEMGGEDWGWVEFELAEEAEEAVQGFDGVVLADQPMECRLSRLQGDN
jgi:hypothetical protein